jgi:release factor glutamine methyltransferase
MLIRTSPHVYGPEEDTYFLLEALEDEDLSGNGLELGVGTGFIALHVCHRFKTFTATDINPEAVALAARNAQTNNCNNITFLVSDLFSSVEGTFDVIICNPPYVPADEDITGIEDLSYHGGEDGRGVIDQVLAQFPPFLNPDGKVYVVQSSLSDIEKTQNVLKEMGFSSEIIARKRLFFEKLVVFRIKGGIK